jgi:enoyl-CoA hydratase/3-hydroxyacyl-CoA dehydrogenase
MKTITTVGVVGAGTMGSALAQKFAQEGFAVVLLDRAMTLVERGMASITRTLQEGVERRIFSTAETETILQRIHPTERREDLAQCDLIVEAIFEDLQAKSDLFAALGSIVSPDAIVATNTSSFSVGELARSIAHPERFCGLHYFYHAAKNRLVEIVAGEKSSPETIRTAARFAVLTGKDPIYSADRHGFVVNRFFVPWLNEAVRLLQEGVASVPAIDSVCMKVFGIGMGPFALMNATGVPIAYHAQRTLESFGTLYAVADMLRSHAEQNLRWELGDPASTVVDAASERCIRDRMLGTVFLVCGQILEERVCSAVDLNRGARIGLKWRRGPIEMMRELGAEEVERLVRGVATRYQTAFPRALKHAAEPLNYVTLRRAGRNAVITIERPEDLNALNEEIVAQLDARFAEAELDSACNTIIITGTGKAFVAGADISLFLKNMRGGTIDRIIAFTERTQKVFDRIDRSPKRVVALLNGMALGGGLELALCADTILALPGVRVAFPETGIGIYPGLGGTQRTQERIGKGLTKYLIYTGEMLGATAAAEMGLIDGVISTEVFFALNEGGSIDELSPPDSTARDARWMAINAFFETNSLDRLLDATPCDGAIPAEDIERWRGRVRQKAPIALRTAERLVDEARGCASELEFLPTIFNSNDALLGLTSIGRKVAFKGN